MIKESNYRLSKYPFTGDSTLRLNDKVVLSRGIIISARLYPRVVSQTSGYLYIHAVTTKYFKDGKGCLQVFDSNLGDIGLEVVFNLRKQSSYVHGYALQDSCFRGSITATRDILPWLAVDRVLDPSAFIFSPSAGTSIPVDSTGGSGGLLDVDNNPITELSYDPEYFENSKVKAYTASSGGSTVRPVTGLTITAKTAGGDAKSIHLDTLSDNINIKTTKGSLLRIDADSNINAITLGGLDDLSSM